MTAQILDGRVLAARVRADIAARVATLAFQPGLAVVLVGDNPASAVYVRSKDRAAQAAGIAAQTIRLPSTIGEAALLAEITRLNDDDSVHGILIQLPLPAPLRARAIIEALDPAKDVDGLHPLNAGLLREDRAHLAPCTPRGVMRLLAGAQIPLAGARALVLGRSILVGKPLAAMLLAKDATVTVAHSRTRDLAGECRRADVLIAAVGHPALVQGDWIKPGAAIIDVGINRLPNGSLAGDVNYAECAAIAGWITPVPGGVGPMTIACLLENTVTAAMARRGGP